MGVGAKFARSSEKRAALQGVPGYVGWVEPKEQLNQLLHGEPSERSLGRMVAAGAKLYDYLRMAVITGLKHPAIQPLYKSYR